MIAPRKSAELRGGKKQKTVYLCMSSAVWAFEEATSQFAVRSLLKS